jgi:nicotinamide riboside transporter PnuC
VSDRELIEYLEAQKREKRERRQAAARSVWKAVRRAGWAFVILAAVILVVRVVLHFTGAGNTEIDVSPGSTVTRHIYPIMPGWLIALTVAGALVAAALLIERNYRQRRRTGPGE